MRVLMGVIGIQVSCLRFYSRYSAGEKDISVGRLSGDVA